MRAVMFVDLDRDGDEDLLLITGSTGGLANGNDKQNFIYRNDAGTFQKVESGAIYSDTFVSAGGVAVGDINGDGWMDIYIANNGLSNINTASTTAANYLYTSNQNGLDFTKVTSGDAVNPFAHPGPPETRYHRYLFLLHKQSAVLALSDDEKASLQLRTFFDYPAFCDTHSLGSPVAQAAIEAQLDAFVVQYYMESGVDLCSYPASCSLVA